jgi:hypothetical protein
MRSKRQSAVNNLDEQVHHSSASLSESKVPSMMLRAKAGEGFNFLAFGGGPEGPNLLIKEERPVRRILSVNVVWNSLSGPL